MESASPASFPMVTRIGPEIWAFPEVGAEKASYDRPKKDGSDGMEVRVAAMVVKVRYGRVVFVLQVIRVERRTELCDAQDTTEVTWNAPMGLERRSNVVAAAARLALMAMGRGA